VDVEASLENKVNNGQTVLLLVRDYMNIVAAHASFNQPNWGENQKNSAHFCKANIRRHIHLKVVGFLISSGKYLESDIKLVNQFLL